ncbi:MAG: hypothetical protein WC891_01460 [Actinomycetota bacterium]
MHQRLWKPSYSFLLVVVAAIVLVVGLPAAAAAAAAGPVVAVPITVSLSPFVSPSQCAFCHGSNLDNFSNPILYFKHDPHLTRGIRCGVCHTSFPHEPGGTVKPSMTVCYNCHNVGHGDEGLVASGACAYCHPQGYGDPPASHTVEFKGGRHKDEAKTDTFPCLTCHISDMCAGCHTAKAVKPDDHKNVFKWLKAHGTKRDDANCEICHTKDFCNECHVTPMPHPARWEGEHKSTAKAMKSDCKVCHADTEKECSSCHHQFKGNTLLVESNCTPCHDDYKAPLSTLTWAEPVRLRSKGIIIHKAHFEMTKTDPFECNECHDRGFESAKGCFSFELCYTCHGKLRGGSMIAKWGGQELCYRCHRTK